MKNEMTSVYVPDEYGLIKGFHARILATYAEPAIPQGVTQIFKICLATKYDRHYWQLAAETYDIRPSDRSDGLIDVRELPIPLFHLLGGTIDLKIDLWVEEHKNDRCEIDLQFPIGFLYEDKVERGYLGDPPPSVKRQCFNGFDLTCTR